MSARVAVLGTGMLTMVIFAGTADAQTATVQAVASNPLDSLGTPVGLSAVCLGVVGMVAGVLRRKKVAVQPENQRKVP